MISNDTSKAISITIIGLAFLGLVTVMVMIAKLIMLLS